MSKKILKWSFDDDERVTTKQEIKDMPCVHGWMIPEFLQTLTWYFLVPHQAFMQMLIKEHSEYIFYVNSAMDYEGALAFARFTLLLKDLDLTRPKMFQIWRWSSCSKVLFLPGWTWTLFSWPGFHNQETQKYPFDILAYSTIIDSTSGRLFRRWSSVGQGCEGAGVHYMMTTRRRGVLHQKNSPFFLDLICAELLFHEIQLKICYLLFDCRYN